MHSLLVEIHDVEASLFTDALNARFEVREQILHDADYRRHYVLGWLARRCIAIDARPIAHRLGQLFMACYGAPIAIYA